MAEKFLPKETVGKISNNIFDDLKPMLESNLMFQNVGFFGFSKTEEFSNFCKATKIKSYLICQTEDNEIEKMSCLVVKDAKQIDYVKKISTQLSIPYIIIIDEIFESNFYSCFYFENNLFKKTNPPWAIILNENSINNNFNRFMLLGSMDIFSNLFERVENFCKKLFFNSLTDNQKEACYEKILCNQLDLIKEKNQINKRSAMENYLNFLLLKINQKPNVLFLLNQLIIKNYKTINHFYSIFVCSQALLELYESFIKHFKFGYAQDVDYFVHNKYLKELGSNAKVGILHLDYLKSTFILEKFKDNLLEEIAHCKEGFYMAKSGILKFDVDFYYNLSQTRLSCLNNCICLTADLIDEPSLLKLMLEFGLLNFNFWFCFTKNYNFWKFLIFVFDNNCLMSNKTKFYLNNNLGKFLVFCLLICLFFLAPQKNALLLSATNVLNCSNIQYNFYTSNAMALLTDAEVIQNGNSYIVKCGINDCNKIKRQLEDIAGESVSFFAELSDLYKSVDLLNASVVFCEETNGIVVLYAFTQNIKNYVRVNGELVNLQLAYKSNRITIGTPLILGSY